MSTQHKLAIDGGTPAKSVPHGELQRFGPEELENLRLALEQNTLFYAHGEWVKRACEKMVAYTGVPHVAACSSGSAAVHLGLVAAGIGPGDEVVCIPNTDSGSVLGIIAEGAVPVFCDCEMDLQPSARTIEPCITERTKAVLVIHLGGYPARVDEIVRLCESRGLAVVEDCAQSWGTRLDGKLVGSFGTAGCYSANDFKHISTGDGGFVALQDEALYRRVVNYADKHYDRFWGAERMQMHQGINYRMTELQGAVACAQLDRVDAITGRFHEVGEALRAGLADLPGGEFVAPLPGAYATYWWILFRVNPEAVRVSRDELSAALQAEGVLCDPYARYDLISKPLFQERQVRPWLDDERAAYPFVQPDGRSYTYSLDSVPNHRRLMKIGIRFRVHGGFTDRDVEETIAGTRKVLEAYAV